MTEARSGQQLGFMHVSKTAGTSIISALETAYAGRSIVRGFDRSLFGAFDDFASFDEGPRNSIYMSPQGLPAKADMIAGHFSFSTLRETYPHASLMTVLREPMTRLLSHWIYWRQFSAGDLTGWGGWIDRVRLAQRPLADFLSLPDIAAQTDNLFLRQLLWPHPLVPDAGFIDWRHDLRLLRLAADRLRQFEFVDAVEHAGLAERLERWLGRPLSVSSLNATETMPEHLRTPLARELSEKAWSRLHASSRLDARLWTALTARRLGRVRTEILRGRTIASAVARYAIILGA